MSFPDFPRELLDLIFNELGARHDTATLRVCSLVSWTFLQISRSYLYAHIRLTQEPIIIANEGHRTDHNNALLKNFVLMIKHDPSRNTAPLTSQVRFVELILSSPPIPWFKYRGKPSRVQELKNQQKWNRLNANIPIILRQLTRIERFSVRFPLNSACEWSLIDKALRSAVVKFCSSPSLTTLEFGYIAGLPLVSIIANCARLKNITLDSLEFRVQSSSSMLSKIGKFLRPTVIPPTIRPLPTINSLSVRGETLAVPLALLRNRLEHDFPISICGHISQLDLSVIDETLFPEQWALIRMLSSTLQTLRFSDVLTHKVHPGAPVRLNMLPVLRRLELTFCDASWRTGIEALACWQDWVVFTHNGVPDLISATLETLTITMKWSSVYHTHHTLPLEAPGLTHACQTFDTHLCGGAFPSLRNVSLNITPHYKLSSDIVIHDRMYAMKYAARMIEDGIRQLLPHLAESTTMQLDLNVTPSIHSYIRPHRRSYDYYEDTCFMCMEGHG